MSIRENFEKKYSSAVETCSDDILEAIDSLLDSCDELEHTRDTLRKRIFELERQNSALMAFFSEASEANSLGDDMEEMISTVDAAAAKLEELRAVTASLSSVGDFCRDVYSALIRLSKESEECEASLRGGSYAPSYTSESENAYLQDECEVQDDVGETKDTETLEHDEPMQPEENADAADTDDVSLIADRLRSMMSEEEAPAEKASIPEDDDFSRMIMDFFSEDKKEEPKASEPKNTAPADATDISEPQKPEKKAPVIMEIKPEEPYAESADEAIPASEIGAEPVEKKPEDAPKKKNELQSIRDSLLKIKNKRNVK